MHHVVDLDVTIVIIAPPAGEEGEVHALFKQWLKKKTNSTDDYTFVVYVGNECPVGMFLHTHTHTYANTHLCLFYWEKVEIFQGWYSECHLKGKRRR